MYQTRVAAALLISNYEGETSIVACDAEAGAEINFSRHRAAIFRLREAAAAVAAGFGTTAQSGARERHFLTLLLAY